MDHAKNYGSSLYYRRYFINHLGGDVMKATINRYGKPVFEGVDSDTLMSELEFHTPKHFFETDIALALHTNIGSITVLDRMTGFSGIDGFGVRDTETGYRTPEGEFYLASGNYDVRRQNFKTIGEAIVWIIDNANTCRGNE